MEAVSPSPGARTDLDRQTGHLRPTGICTAEIGTQDDASKAALKAEMAVTYVSGQNVTTALFRFAGELWAKFADDRPKG